MSLLSPRTKFIRELAAALGGSFSDNGWIDLPFGIINIACRKKLDGVNLQSFWVRPSQRGRGFGEHMLRHVLVVADRIGVPIYLRSKPYGRSKNRMEIAKLRQWYVRFGFWRCNAPDGDRGWMWRPVRACKVRVNPRPRMRKSQGRRAA